MPGGASNSASNRSRGAFSACSFRCVNRRNGAGLMAETKRKADLSNTRGWWPRGEIFADGLNRCLGIGEDAVGRTPVDCVNSPNSPAAQQSPQRACEPTELRRRRCRRIRPRAATSTHHVQNLLTFADAAAPEDSSAWSDLSAVCAGGGQCQNFTARAGSRLDFRGRRLPFPAPGLRLASLHQRFAR